MQPYGQQRANLPAPRPRASVGPTPQACLTFPLASSQNAVHLVSHVTQSQNLCLSDDYCLTDIHLKVAATKCADKYYYYYYFCPPHNKKKEAKKTVRFVTIAAVMTAFYILILVLVLVLYVK